MEKSKRSVEGAGSVVGKDEDLKALVQHGARIRGKYARAVNLSQKVAVNTFLLVASRLVVAASGLAGVAVTSRYLAPADFGQLTVAIVFVSIFGLFTDAGLYTITSREIAKRPAEQDQLLNNAFTMGLLLSVGAVIVAFTVMVTVYGGADSHLIRLGVGILAVQMLASPAGGTTAAYLGAHQRVAPFALGGVIASVIFVSSLLVAVDLDLGFAGLAGCFALSGVINLVFPFAVVREVRPRLAYDRVAWREMLRWGLPQAGVLILAVLYFRVDTFLLSFLASDAEVGRYGVAYRVLEVLIVFPTYFMATLFPEIARQAPHSARLNELVQGAFSTLVLVAVPLVVVFAVFSGQVVAVAAGPRYSDAAPVLAVLVVAVAILFVNTVYFHSLVALNQQRRLFMMLLAVLAFNVLLNLVLIPRLGAMGAAIALVASEAVVCLLAARAFARVGRVPRLLRPVRIALAAAVTVSLILLLHAVIPEDQRGGDLGASFGAAVAPLSYVAIAALLTLAVWVGALRTFRAVPSEVAGAINALRRRHTADPVTVSTGIGS